MNEWSVEVRFMLLVVLVSFMVGVFAGSWLGGWIVRDFYQKEAIRAGVACYGAVTGKFMWIASSQEPRQEEPRDARRINSGNKDSRIETGNITIKE